MIKRLFIFIFCIGFLMLSSSGTFASTQFFNCSVDVDAQEFILRENRTPTQDEIDEYDRQCNPPRLRAIQETAVNIVYILWVAGIPVFGGATMFIGYQYMVSNGDPNAFGDLKRKGAYIGAGLVVFVGTHPLAAGAMKLVINNDTACYAGLDTPGFRIFFANVCTNDSVYTVDTCGDLPDQDQACLIACGIYGQDGNALNCTGGPTCELRLNNYAFQQDQKLFIQDQLICNCPDPALPPAAVNPSCQDVSPASGAQEYP